MTLFNVRPEKESQLLERMARLGMRECDLVEKFVKGSGKGGQKVNKTSSCVYILHRPSGIEVKCQRERSQAMNRFLARRELCERLACDGACQGGLGGDLVVPCRDVPGVERVREDLGGGRLRRGLDGLLSWC